MLRNVRFIWFICICMAGEYCVCVYAGKKRAKNSREIAYERAAKNLDNGALQDYKIVEKHPFCRFGEDRMRFVDVRCACINNGAVYA